MSERALSGKRALITGSGTGIGRGIAIECARAGAMVAVHYSHDPHEAAEVVAEIKSLGGEAQAFGADFTDTSAIPKLAEEARNYLGDVDILVNNAGIIFNAPVENVTTSQFETLYRVNVQAGFFLVQELLPTLRKQRGAVVNIASIHAFEGRREHSVYAGAKGAVVAMTRALAIELAPQGVRVNAIAPGCVPVTSYAKAVGPVDVEQLGREIPAGCVGTPQDIGKAVVFLASQDSKFILGQTLVVDGGTTSWMPFGEGFRDSMAEKGLQFGREYLPGL
jgi:3-oxoacyl-[acyl-carrier protein] reductase